MQSDDVAEGRSFYVVINAEEQYSIWLADNEIPAGWTAVGPARPKADCLKYIDQVWTDMRPLSLRNQMDHRDVSP